MKTIDLTCAGFGPERPTSVLSGALSAVQTVSIFVEFALGVNCPVTNTARYVADDRTQRTRGTTIAVSDTDQPNTQRSTAQQHSLLTVMGRTARHQSAGNPVTQTTNERPEISDHDPE